MTKRALMVVAKKPAPGHTKTRLCPPLTGEQAAQLYEAFLLDTLALIRQARQQLEFQPIIVYLADDSPDSEAYFAALAPDFQRFEQVGANLSARLNHATMHCLTTLGYDQAAIMNSDSPSLPSACLVEAFTALDNADVTLGTTDDGGYYIIGLKQPAPPLFLTVTMSTPTVAQDTLDRAKDQTLSVKLLPQSHDVDYIDDLRALAAELSTLPPEVAPHTRRFLAANPDVLKD